LGKLIKLAQLELTLPLHTASCERVFLQQNVIRTCTKQRNSFTPLGGRLLIVRLNRTENLDYEDVLKKWNALKKKKPALCLVSQ
jgi:hypothetical protein